MTQLDTALASNAWPFKEAERILNRIGNKVPEKGYVLFETGYGPSGLPHIGTFGEVARTSIVRHAFETIAPNIPTKLFAFSDDMDGLRKVPDNIPQGEMVAQHLNKPLTAIPDPFGTDESYGAHMNKRLCKFLDHFGFDYEFKSATHCYQSGLFDEALLSALKAYQAIMDVMLPTLGKERQATYSPFMPICPETGHVLQVPTIATDPEKGTITYRRDDGSEIETEVTAGKCKLQWKPDWGMRWAALGVDYEMHGKDLLPSAQISSKISRAIGGTPPELFMYELFLDEQGQKISKSKGNGLSLDEWLRYGPAQSLSYYMYQSPRKAKRLYFDVIPRAVDDYLTHIQKFAEQEEVQQLANPAWHVHYGNLPDTHCGDISFNLLLNLAGACHATEASVLWGFISQYNPDVNPENAPFLDEMVKHALHYYEDFVKPTKKYRAPTEEEIPALKDLIAHLQKLDKHTPADAIQTEIFTVGKNNNYSNLREWFKVLYEVLLGQEQGPRMGSFVALYGIDETIQLIENQLVSGNE